MAVQANLTGTAVLYKLAQRLADSNHVDYNIVLVWFDGHEFTTPMKYEGGEEFFKNFEQIQGSPFQLRVDNVIATIILQNVACSSKRILLNETKERIPVDFQV